MTEACMHAKPHPKRIEELTIRDEKLSITIISLLAILVIFLNLNFANLLPVGTGASIVYLFINGTFLGHTFFEGEVFILKLLLGNLLLLVFLGFTSWIFVIVSNLDIVRSVTVLFVVAVSCSLLNRFGTRLRGRQSSVE